MRADRPVGTFLLLWPTLTALIIAGKGNVETHLLIIFCLGTFLMRSAGCVINDYFDQDFDRKVLRTSKRPLASGIVSNSEALTIFGILIFLSLILLTFLNFLSFIIAFAFSVLVILYPLAKRVIKIPQIILGIVFSGGIPLAFAASLNDLPANVFVLMLANFFWILSYDTAYAMTDREDDQLLKLGNSAILIKGKEKLIIFFGSMINLFLIFFVGISENINSYFYIISVINGCFLIYSIIIIDRENVNSFFNFFKKNNYIGALIFFSFYIGLN
jgi:4-hydroxybenzoate polyprenyltransferase